MATQEKFGLTFQPSLEMSENITDTVAQFILGKVISIKLPYLQTLIFQFIDDFQLGNSITLLFYTVVKFKMNFRYLCSDIIADCQCPRVKTLNLKVHFAVSQYDSRKPSVKGKAVNFFYFAKRTNYFWGMSDP